MKKYIVWLLVVVFSMSMVLMGIGCKEEVAPVEEDVVKEVEEEVGEEAAEEVKPVEEEAVEKKVIGLAMHFMQDDYAKFLTKAFKEVVDKAGYEAIMIDGQGDPQKQLNDVNTLITKKVDAIVICPMDEKAVKDVCNDATSQGIPIIAITYMPDVNVTTTIQGGDYPNGFGAAQLLVDELGGKGKIALLDISFEIFRVQERVVGFMDALKDTEIEIIDTQKMLTKDDFMAATETILTAHEDLDGILCSFGNPIYGAGSALKAMNIEGVVVTGIDADLDIMNLIMEGWVTGAAAQFPSEHGRLAAEAAVKIIRGETPDESVEVPYKIVTKENTVEMAKILWDADL